MGRYQANRGNPEQKLFYLVDQLVGGVNTDFSDDTSNDNEFKSIINFNMDKRGSLYKRMGFGKQTALSQIFNLFDSLPTVKCKTPEDPYPEKTNDNIIYMKLLVNDNNCYRNLSAYTGEKAYRKYQEIYGSQNNKFKLMIITTNGYTNTSKAWIYSCTLPELEYEEGIETDEDTIIVSQNTIDLPVVFNWDKTLTNIDTIEYYNKIYFTTNDKGLVCFNRDNDTFTYVGVITNVTNNAYKPSPMEIRKVGFNVLGTNPLTWVDYQGISTDSIQGVVLMTSDGKPLTYIPNGINFRIMILYTGNDGGFNISFKENDNTLSATVTANTQASSTGMKVYDVKFATTPTTQVEIKIEKTGSSISPYYDYYDVQQLDNETKAISALNIGSYSMTNMYDRAVYYKDDTIWFSELNNFSYVPNYNYVTLPLEPTDKITKIIYFRNVYIIFTKQRIYKMLGSFGTSDFQILPLNMSIGCHAPHTVVPIENVLYFASPRGLYELVSSAMYSSSGQTFENVKELDTKVKNLTSDLTMYVGEKSDPATRYNGISEKAYAIRYKDKYMLFFNTAYENNDIAGEQNLDVLTYQYDLKAFSEIKFAIKPTFIFMAENAIETFATIKQKEDYTNEEDLLEYDFEADDGSGGVVTDLTGNGYDANLMNGATLALGKGVETNSPNNYIKLGNISSSYRIDNGFNLKLKCNIDQPGSTVLFDLKKANATGQAIPQTFTIETNWSNGYRGVLHCTTVPNSTDRTDKINWYLSWQRYSLSINASQSGEFSLKDTSTGAYLIPPTNFTFNFQSDKTNTDVYSGSFTISHDSQGNYGKNWTLNVSSYSPTYYDYYEKGVNQYFDVSKFDNSWGGGLFGIRYVGNAVAKDGGCDLTITTYFVIKSGASVAIGSRDLELYLDGTHKFNLASANGSGYKEFNCGTKTISFNYEGQPTKTVDGMFPIKATISGVYRAQVAPDAFTINLPSVYRRTGINWNSFSVSGTKYVSLNQILLNSYQTISLMTNISNNNVLNFYCSSSYGSENKQIINNNLSTLGNHEWKIVFNKSGSNASLSVIQDDTLFGSVSLNANYFMNSDRDNCMIANGFVGDGLITYFELSNINNIPIIKYDFTEGSGTSIIDKSGNNINGTIYGNITWSVERGLKLNGTNAYLLLPEITSDVRFTNGYSIEFEMKANSTRDISRIIDLATSYDTSISSKCGINAGIDGAINKLAFRSAGIDNKTYSAIKENADITNRHKWKYSAIDNGSGYDIQLYYDDTLIYETQYTYGGITNINRRSNFIGRSNNPNEKYFSGMIYNLKITINASSSPVPIYEGALYEYDTTYDDFGRPIEIYIETKGINLNYPMHTKKLKNIFIKGLGGYTYNSFFLEVYADGHLINDPRVYRCYVDDLTHQVVYEYVETKALSFNEIQSLLGNLRLDYTRLGETTYETKRIVVPGRGKNFSIKIYGESSDRLSIESFGYNFKLGKVREE